MVSIARVDNGYLLLNLQEAGQVGGVQVVFVVAVREHEEVQVPAGRHHLVEGAELLKAQLALVVVSVCLLHTQGTVGLPLTAQSIYYMTRLVSWVR